MDGSEERGDVMVTVPRTAEEVAALEARYTPFASFDSWTEVTVDAPRWSRFAAILERRSGAADEAVRTDITDRLLRAAALDSAALDGLLAANPELTTAVLSSAISNDDAMSAVNESVRVVAECNYRALMLAQDAARDGRPVDDQLIALLQDVITEAQATFTVTNEKGKILEVELPRRQYKPVTNYLHYPDGRMALLAPAARVPDEMQRLVAELASAPFQRAHPVLQAAYVHYALIVIHPFADGNGRVARALASLYLLRAVGVPMLVFADQWPAYYQAIWQGRQGEPQRLADAVAAYGMATMDLAANLLSPTTGAVLAAAPQAPASGPEEGSSAVEQAARSLLDVLWIELREALVSPPAGVRMAVAETRAVPTGHVESAYRVVEDPITRRTGVQVAIRSEERPAMAWDLEFLALASVSSDDLLPVALRETASCDLLEVTLDDAYPLPLEGTVLRIRAWIKRLLSDVIRSVLEPPPGSAG